MFNISIPGHYHIAQTGEQLAVSNFLVQQNTLVQINGQ